MAEMVGSEHRRNLLSHNVAALMVIIAAADDDHVGLIVDVDDAVGREIMASLVSRERIEEHRERCRRLADRSDPPAPSASSGNASRTTATRRRFRGGNGCRDAGDSHRRSGWNHAGADTADGSVGENSAPFRGKRGADERISRK